MRCAPRGTTPGLHRTHRARARPRHCAGPVGRRLGDGFVTPIRWPLSGAGTVPGGADAIAGGPQALPGRTGALPSRPKAVPSGTRTLPGRPKAASGRSRGLPGRTQRRPGRAEAAPGGTREREPPAQGKSRHPVQLAGGGPPLPRGSISTSEDALQEARPGRAGDAGREAYPRADRPPRRGAGDRAARRVRARPADGSGQDSGLRQLPFVSRTAPTPDHRPRSGGPDAIGRGVVSGGGAVSDVSR